MKKAVILLDNGLRSFGSPTRTRTRDKVVNSHLLYRLSYWGIENSLVPRPHLGCQAERLSQPLSIP